MADDVITAPAPETPVVPETPVTERPRDEKGRFSKENMAAAMGMAPEATPAPVAATPATTATPETPAPAAEDPLSAIDAFLQSAPADVAEPAVEPQTPQVPETPEILQVKQWQQDPSIAAEAVAAARAHVLLNEKFNRGDIEGALGMIAPGVVAAITEHLYQQNRDAWAQRYADEASGVRQTDPRLEAALQKIAAFEQTLTQRQLQEAEQRQRAQQQRQSQELNTRLNTYMNGLFESAGLKDSPQRIFLEGALRQKLGANPQALRNIQSGRFGDIGSAFRELYVQFKPQMSSAVPSQTATSPQGSTSLMTSASGLSSTPAPADDLVVDGQLSGKGIVRRMKDFLKTGSGQ